MNEVRYRDALRDAQAEEMERDDRVLVVGEDIRDPWGGTYKATRGLSTRFGDDRVLNTPIAEESIVSIALGAAIGGMRPIAEIMYFDFITRAMDSVVNQVAKIRYMSGGQVAAPVVIRTQGGGGRSSAAQHGGSLEAWMCHVPGLLVAMPATPADAKGLLKAAVRIDDPVIFIEHKMLYSTKGPVPDGEHLVEFGVADIKRGGTDATIVATSRMVVEALAAAASLAEDGIEVEVIDPRTLVPLDLATVLASVAKTGHLIVVHEAVERCGWGAELVAQVQARAWGHLKAPIQRVAARNVPLPFAPNLESEVLPDAKRIQAAVLSCLSEGELVR